MREWLFRETSYKKALARLIEESAPERGTISRIADAIGCQRSYLSQVLHAKAQLTKDQAWNLCTFFGLPEMEATYFECLVDFERASTLRDLEAAYPGELIAGVAGNLEPMARQKGEPGLAQATAYFARMGWTTSGWAVPY